MTQAATFPLAKPGVGRFLITAGAMMVVDDTATDREWVIQITEL